MLAEARGADAPTLLFAEGRPPDTGTLILLSGSFDPVTRGHVGLAEALRMPDATTVLVYSVRTLEKESGAEAPLLREEERLDLLLQVAVPWRHVVAIASHGLLADQAEAARRAAPGARLWAAMGSDKVTQILDPRWYDDRDAALDRLYRDLEGVFYAERAGQGRSDTAESPEARLREPDVKRWRDRFRRVELPDEQASISSREVRRKLRAGLPVDRLVPQEVAEALRNRSWDGPAGGPQE